MSRTLWHSDGKRKRRVEAEEEAILVSSLLKDGSHAPVLDLDRVGARLVPSSTEGNYHLYLDQVRLTWEQYRLLLTVLAELDIIEPGWAEASKAHGMTLVRREGLTKETTPLEPTYVKLDDGLKLLDQLVSHP